MTIIMPLKETALNSTGEATPNNATAATTPDEAEEKVKEKEIRRTRGFTRRHREEEDNEDDDIKPKRKKPKGRSSKGKGRGKVIEEELMDTTPPAKEGDLHV